MLHTMNRAEWKEDPVDERMRDTLTPSSAPSLMRRLYPLTGKLKFYCRVHQLPSGTILEYVRTKQTPAMYPIEALIIKDGRVNKSCYNSDELEIKEW